MRQNWKMNVRLVTVGTVIGVFIGFVIGMSLAINNFGRGNSAFRTHESHVDFENAEYSLMINQVFSNRPEVFDPNRWVVILTHKASGQSIELLTSHTSFPSEKTSMLPKFKAEQDGFSYESDVATFRMTWPKMDFQFKRGFRPDEWSNGYHLGGPRF